MLENANEIYQKAVEPVPGYCSTTLTAVMFVNSAYIPASFVTTTA